MVITKKTLHRLIETMPDDELEQIERLLHGEQLPERLDLATLIAQHQTIPPDDLFALAAGIWPEDESVEEFLAARESWRRASEDA